MDTRSPIIEHKALMEGHEAGRQNLAAGLNPYRVGSRDAHDWERGRCIQIALKLSRQLERRAVTSPCHYKAELECTCGGRGFCLDVA